MSRLIARILLTVMIFPLAALLLALSFIFLDRLRMNDEAALVASAIIAAVYMVLYWLLIWFASVVWTARRQWLTIGCAAAAAIASAAMGWAINHLIPYDDWLGGFMGALLAPVLWIIGTICTWRETEAERAARISRAGADVLVCPSCGYNMTGLRESLGVRGEVHTQRTVCRPAVARERGSRSRVNHAAAPAAR